MADMHDSNSGVSDYEKLRLQNIERNNSFLAGLGFQETPKEIQSNSSSSSHTKCRSTKKRRSDLPDIPLELMRRSNRISAIPPPDYKDIVYSEMTSQRTPSVSKPRNESSRSSSERALPPPNSSRALEASLEPFLNERLGEDLDAPLKSDVIKLASIRAVSFNKYSGVIEWTNCVFLWVNAQTGSDFPNKFLDGGRRFTWYGGSKMYADTPVVRRLSAIASGGSTDQIILFVRFEKESYVSLGRLGFDSSNLNAQPVQFIWNLLDFDTLRHKTYFARVLKTLG